MVMFVQQVSRFLEAWLTGTSPVQYTPAGLAWASEWGTLRYTMNAALIAEVVAKHIISKFSYVSLADAKHIISNLSWLLLSVASTASTSFLVCCFLLPRCYMPSAGQMRSGRFVIEHCAAVMLLAETSPRSIVA